MSITYLDENCRQYKIHNTINYLKSKNCYSVKSATYPKVINNELVLVPLQRPSYYSNMIDFNMYIDKTVFMDCITKEFKSMYSNPVARDTYIHFKGEYMYAPGNGTNALLYSKQFYEDRIKGTKDEKYFEQIFSDEQKDKFITSLYNNEVDMLYDIFLSKRYYRPHQIPSFNFSKYYTDYEHFIKALAIISYLGYSATSQNIRDTAYNKNIITDTKKVDDDIKNTVESLQKGSI